MEPRVIGVVLALVLLPGACEALPELWRSGPLASKLSADDVAAIEKVASAEGRPWAVAAWSGRQSAPQSLSGIDVWFVEVLLVPTTATARVRRGRVVSLRCWPLPDQASCLYWKRREPDGSYAQVADGQGFGASLTPRSRREEPFSVVGPFSDDELETLVSYVRSGPSVNEFMRLDQPLLIRDMRREPDGGVVVGLEGAEGRSMAASFRHTKSGWVLTQISEGVG